MDTQTWFATLFNLYKENLNGLREHPITGLRKEGFKKLQLSEFPTRRDEDWKYTTFSRALDIKYQEGTLVPIESEVINRCLFDDLDVLKMVFINGHFSPEHSQSDEVSSGLQIIPVLKALQNKELSAWINRQMALEGGTAKNTFLSLNQAFANNGFVIIVDKNVAIKRPIHFVNINISGEEAHMTSPQLFIKAHQGSLLTIIESHHNTDNEAMYFTNATSRIDVDANANVHHYRIQLESKSAFQVNNTFVTQDRDSTYSSYAVDLGGKMVRNNIASEHKGPGIQTNYYGVYMANEDQHIDNQTFVDHAVPHCQSNEVYKGILDGKSRGVFNGKILVRRDAQKTNAFQQNHSLVLTPTAIMDAKPQLEIYADDVKCSHGATIGQMDESSVFYLRSRGIPKQQALTLLQQAFVGEVLDKMEIKIIRDRILGLIEQKLNH